MKKPAKKIEPMEMPDLQAFLVTDVDGIALKVLIMPANRVLPGYISEAETITARVEQRLTQVRTVFCDDMGQLCQQLRRSTPAQEAKSDMESSMVRRKPPLEKIES